MNKKVIPSKSSLLCMDTVHYKLFFFFWVVDSSIFFRLSRRNAKIFHFGKIVWISLRHTESLYPEDKKPAQGDLTIEGRAGMMFAFLWERLSKQWF